FYWSRSVYPHIFRLIPRRDICSFFFFFFRQQTEYELFFLLAEDGIRFGPVTGVRACPRRTVVKPGPRGPEGTLVLRNGRIFDGTGAPAREGTLVIERNKIAKILPPNSTDWPKDAHVVDASGKTILPCLIDLHTHLTYPLNAEDFGVAMN